MSFSPLSDNPNNTNEHYVTLPTCLLKALTGNTDITSVSTLTTLETLFFIKIVSSYQVNQCRPIAISAKEWSKSIGIQTSQASMSGCEILHLQQSLEKKGFLQVKRSKNHRNMDLRNILTPIIPNDLCDVLAHSPSNRSQNDSERRGVESGLQWILRTKLFVPIRYDMLKALLSCEATSVSHKLFVLRNYLTAFKNFQVTSKLAFSVTTKELIAKLGMSRATIFRILKTIRDRSDSNLQITRQYLNSDDLESNRRDKSVFKLTFSADFLPHWARVVLPTVSSFETDSLKIPPLYNKEIIIIKDIDKKDTNLENETSSFSSTFFKNNKDKKNNNNHPIENDLTIPNNKSKPSNLSKRGKTFKEFYPLTKEQVDILNSKSGREFNLNFGNQLLLKFSRDTSKTFLGYNQFMAYMTTAFAHEKRSAYEVNNPNFRLKVNLTNEELVQNKIEEYLTQVESSSDTSYEAQLRKKISGSFDYKLAYQLLTQGKFEYIESMGEGCVKSFRVSIPSCLELTLQQEATLEARIIAVYGEIIVFYETIENTSKATSGFSSKVSEIEAIEELDLNSTWGKIRNHLRKELGENIDRSWFSKLQAEEDNNANVISLIAPTNFIRDMINQRYGRIIRECAGDLGYQFTNLTSSHS